MAEGGIPFSLDADFDELTDKNRTVELIGFICAVQAPVEVGRGIKYNLLKFSLCNGGTKKVQCLIWGTSLIQRYQTDIVINKILHIDGAHCNASRLPYGLEVQGFCPFEIVIQASTVMNFLGMHAPLLEQSTEDVPTIVTFENINQASGMISIDGYIKTKFTSIPSRFENASYGCGSITGGQYKITVNVSNFIPRELDKGIAVNVIGNIDTNNGIPFLISCTNMDCITRRENVLPMSELNLIRGVKMIKR